jgi:hypothetical protein
MSALLVPFHPHTPRIQLFDWKYLSSKRMHHEVGRILLKLPAMSKYKRVSKGAEGTPSTGFLSLPRRRSGGNHTYNTWPFQKLGLLLDLQGAENHYNPFPAFGNSAREPKPCEVRCSFPLACRQPVQISQQYQCQIQYIAQDVHSAMFRGAFWSELYPQNISKAREADRREQKPCSIPHFFLDQCQ